MRRTAQFSLLIVVMAAAIAATVGAVRNLTAKPYKKFVSPDGRFQLIVYRKPQLISSPGGSGDAPGFVRLYDFSGKLLRQKPVEMIENIDQVTWTTNEVEIKLFAKWELP